MTIGEYALRTFWLTTARAAGDSRWRRSIGGRFSVAAAQATDAASSIERALIGSTIFSPCSHTPSGVPGRIPRLWHKRQIGKNRYR